MKILLLGKGGQVGWELQRSLAPLGELIATGSAEADLDRPDDLRTLVRRVEPDIIVNAAAYTAVDNAESEAGKAYRINADAVGVLADEAVRYNAWLIHYSSDYVFDGKKREPYTEEDVPMPLSVYGKSKLAGEENIRRSGARHLVFRASWVFAARGNNFAKTMLRLACEREELGVVADQCGAPTSAELIADVTALALYRLRAVPDVADSLSGTYHLAARGWTTWHEYARYVLQLAQARGACLKVFPDQIRAIPASAYPARAPRPMNSRLDTSRLCAAFGLRLPDWQCHVRRMMDELTLRGVL